MKGMGIKGWRLFDRKKFPRVIITMMILDLIEKDKDEGMCITAACGYHYCSHACLLLTLDS